MWEWIETKKMDCPVIVQNVKLHLQQVRHEHYIIQRELNVEKTARINCRKHVTKLKSSNNNVKLLTIPSHLLHRTRIQSLVCLFSLGGMCAFCFLTVDTCSSALFVFEKVNTSIRVTCWAIEHNKILSNLSFYLIMKSLLTEKEGERGYSRQYVKVAGNNCAFFICCVG